MDERQHCRQQLHDLLHAEYDCAGKLQTLLAEEATALTKRDADALEQLVLDKNALLQQLETLQHSKQAVLSRAGYGHTAADIETCLDWCDERGQLQRGWQLLLERLAHCQHANRINGATLESSRRYAQQALSLLRGAAIPVSLYDPNGSSNAGHDNGRSLAKA